MTLKQLQYFVKIAELGSFTQASRALNVIQPTLSRQIRLLEIEVRHALLIRTGRGVELTEAGNQLLDHARGVLHQMARTEEALGQFAGSPGGRVAVGLPPSIARALTVPLILKFRQRFPAATLAITEAPSTYLQEWIALGRIDVGIIYDSRASPEVQTTPLLSERVILVSAAERHERDEARGHSKCVSESISLQRVARLPLITPSRPHAMRMLVESSFSAIGAIPTIEIEIDGVVAVLELVREGFGHAVLPQSALRSARDPNAFMARPITQPKLYSKICSAISARRPSTRTQTAVLKLIGETLPESLRCGSN